MQSISDAYSMEIQKEDAEFINIILSILLFCDDETIIADCPFVLQEILDIQLINLKEKGMKLHPKKSQLIYFGKKYLNEEQKRKEIIIT